MQNSREKIESLPFSSRFAKFCGSKRETLIVLQKRLRTEVRKVGGNVAFYAIWPILLRQMQSKTRQDVNILTFS